MADTLREAMRKAKDALRQVVRNTTLDVHVGGGAPASADLRVGKPRPPWHYVIGLVVIGFALAHFTRRR